MKTLYRSVNGLLTSAPCAWCDYAAGIVRPPGVSHGICARHRRLVLGEAYALRGEMNPEELNWRRRRKLGRLKATIYSVAFVLAMAALGLVVGLIVAAVGILP